MAEVPEGVVTICNVCSAPKPEGTPSHEPCGTDGCEGIYAQHEDALLLEIRRMQALADARNKPAADSGSSFEVEVGDAVATDDSMAAAHAPAEEGA